jgi:PHP family Zn ribbon phosphoesterase
MNFELWLFAARYNLYELEEHCRTVPGISTKIYQHITIEGVSALLDHAVPLKTVDKIVVSIMVQLKSQGFDVDPCQRCQARRSKGPVEELQWLCGGCGETNRTVPYMH